MGLDLIPKKFKKSFDVAEHRNACAILAIDCPDELDDLLTGLAEFQLLRSEIIAEGGNKSPIAARIERIFQTRGWCAKSCDIEWIVDGKARPVKTHTIDLWKGGVACEIQWNSKDGVFSRDLATLRLLHELEIISAGVIITRGDELQKVFDSLGWINTKKGRPQRIGSKYGESATHWSKLTDRINNDDAGMCPVLMIGIGTPCYRDDIRDVPSYASKESLPKRTA
jgi:hypothetical protein